MMIDYLKDEFTEPGKPKKKARPGAKKFETMAEANAYLAAARANAVKED